MSVPWIWETSKASMRFGDLRKLHRLAQAVQCFARDGLKDSKAPLKRVPGVTRYQFLKRPFGPRLRE